MIHSLQARSSPHLNKVGQEVREAVRAEGYTDGLGQGGGCGGEGHDMSWVEGWVVVRQTAGERSNQISKILVRKIRQLSGLVPLISISGGG